MDKNNSNTIFNFEKLTKDQEEKVRYEVAISLLMLSNGKDSIYGGISGQLSPEHFEWSLGIPCLDMQTTEKIIKNVLKKTKTEIVAIIISEDSKKT